MKTKSRAAVFLLLLLLVGIELQGQNTELDHPAFEKEKAKAEQGDAAAQFNLGLMYANGQDVPQDHAEAVRWFRKAAKQNLAAAQNGLGTCYHDGQGVAKDDVEAVKWYQKAAEQSYAEAQFNLGNAYSFGRGVAKDYVEGVKWYRKAAGQNLAEAQDNLGDCYRDGQGVAKDDLEAVKWFRKAAYQGYADAQYNLAAQYFNGDGVPSNYIDAYKWGSLAASQGNAMAKSFLPIIEMRMTREQVAEAQWVSQEFKPHHLSNSDNDVADSQPTGSGTGFFITDDGYLISNYHVVKDAAQIRLITAQFKRPLSPEELAWYKSQGIDATGAIATISSGSIAAKVVRVDAANDLALLKVEGGFAPLPITSSRTMKLGDVVATVGFPNIGMQGFAPKFARGEIASLSGAADDVRYFQISVPVQPGNSGGALVDEHGNVVGVVSAKLNAAVALAASGALPDNVNYAVKSSFLLSFLESVPEVSAKLKEPVNAKRNFDDVVQSAQAASVLVLVY